MTTETDDIGTVRWFGPSWGAPVNDPRAQIETPIGTACSECGLPFEPSSRGVRIPYAATSVEEHRRLVKEGLLYSHFHLNCWMSILGLGVGELERRR